MENRMFKIGNVTVSDFIEWNNNNNMLITIKKTANIVNLKGIGRNRLYKLLRTLEYLESNNYAKQKYIDEGYFVNSETNRKIGGFERYTNQVFITPKGFELIKQLVDEYLVI